MTKKISELPGAGTLTGTELLEAVQDGTSVAVTAHNVAALAAGIVFLTAPNGATYVLGVDNDGSLLTTYGANDLLTDVPALLLTDDDLALLTD